MPRLCMLVAATTCVLAFPLGAAGPTPRPIAMTAEARVEIDPAGKLVRVESTQDLPAPIRAYIEKEVATWAFKRNDADPTTNASTWLYLSACGVPVEGGYTMGLSYHGNGPRVSGTGWRVSEALANAVGRSRWSGTVQAHYVVNPDGKATLESIDGLPRGQAGKVLGPAVEKWIEGFHYDPETRDDKPIATRATLPLDFRNDVDVPTKETLIARAIESPACKQAGMVAAGMQAVAVDSPVGVTPRI